MFWKSSRIKKLAFDYGTGWEYLPGTKEAGSVLMDAFLDMMEENYLRFAAVWDRQELEFLHVVPDCGEEPGLWKGALSVKASEEDDGKLLPGGTEVCMVPKEGGLIWFVLPSPLKLTNAALECAFYQKGLFAWSALLDGGRMALFSAAGSPAVHPVFCWRASNLCNGLGECRFLTGIPPKLQGGTWSISDGIHTYPLQCGSGEGGVVLCGETPEFSGNLEEGEYEVRLELEDPEAAQAAEEIKALASLSGDLTLWEPGARREAEFCITEDGATDGRKVYPFGRSPEASLCCYIACDEILAREAEEIFLYFVEDGEREENLPPEKPKGYEKFSRKYRWLGQMEMLLEDRTKVWEWKPLKTVWEYFNGNMWRPLPGSMDWQTGCIDVGETGLLRSLSWKRPRDMRPCTIEGEKRMFLRLRLLEAPNAYAAYYRKYIPVLEDICFSAGERKRVLKAEAVPDLSFGDSGKMYLGFDREITADNRWYLEYDEKRGVDLSFAKEQILGWGMRFGRRAFWVEMADPGPREYPENGIRLFPNYAEIEQNLCIPGEEEGPPRGDGSGGNDAGKEAAALAGGVFQVDTEAGMRSAVPVTDFFRKGRTSFGGGKEGKENRFGRFDRIVTVADMETLIREVSLHRQVYSCQLLGEKDLIVEVSGEMAPREREELQEWLEEALGRGGSIWLADCKVTVKTRAGTGGEDAWGKETG